MRKQANLAKRGAAGGSDADVPAFYSKAEQVAATKLPAAGSGDQMLATLRNNGVKESEIGWMGLDDHLSGKPRVTKSDLQQYISEHKIQLKDVDYGTPDQRQLQQLSQERQKIYSENNKIWADHLRYADGATDMFNAMKQGSDLGVKQSISRMAAETQEPARRFVETDGQLRSLDDQIAKLQYKVEKSGAKAPKYESYTLPGEKSNYTEKLLTLPDSARRSAQAEYAAITSKMQEISNRPSAEHTPEVQKQWDNLAVQRRDAYNKLQQTGDSFKTSHFDEPDVLAHVRYDERPSLDGKRTLFIEELQSDWHQKGKRFGYRTAQSPDTAATESAVPQAPFKSDWHELVMKRMLREAAEKGYDRLAWTTGDQQASRYDLSKHFDGVLYDPKKGSLLASPKGSDTYNGYADHVKPEELPNYVGKELAERLLQQKPNPAGFHILNDLDVKLGGEWTKALYDRAIGNFVGKYARKWGAKVGTTDVVTGTDTDRIFVGTEPSQVELKEVWRTSHGTLHTAVNNVISAIQDGRSFIQAMDSYGSEELAEKLGGKMQYGKPHTEKVHSIDITPAMKRSLMKEGQPIARVETKEPETAAA